MATPTRFVLAGVAALLPACYGSTTIGHPDAGADADAPAGTCLGRCTDPYTTGVIACIEDRRACLLACDGFEDHGCIDPCDTSFNACSYERDYEAERCMEGCPCWEPFMACTDGCDDGPGGACWTSCERDYGTCSGDDIVGMGTCLNECATAVVECEMTCRVHERDGDWVAWVSCTSDCTRDWNTCMDGCF